ncbi:Na(+)-translocating NADH-quinone reductase subunit A [Roseisalinus antarcticus]|uniref:Na(+)-translocating NADH-quinone reductase subunit A n=1 Tax=Roseisalinus antarcticus TaxID=254357 RepID=A0A1Y5RVN9_9RHOB|nr:Na(+)-translocating NADH-quinone reductase subunit A [Roseisalinus antarcticus]SLN26249.1 Na(+)-translocating NADH-quinone reductase subunit A [Roseisalinus antarcticus]
MFGRIPGFGLSPVFRSDPFENPVPTGMITEEAAITAPPGDVLRVDLVAPEDSPVAEGAPVARLRNHPEIVLSAPFAGRVARVRLGPGRRLDEIILFRDPGGEVAEWDVAAAASGDAPALVALMQGCGFWPRIRSRPYGRMPASAERPAAIVVMATDSRPLAPDPRLALDGLEEALGRGLAALGRLTDGPVFLCAADGPPPIAPDAAGGARIAHVSPRHPHGLAGFRVHDLCPAAPGRPVWDLHAEDVAQLGVLLATGRLPRTRLVSVAGPALTASRLVRCQLGADLRALSYGLVRPGPHVLMAGSPLDGRRAQWLGTLDRQATIWPQQQEGKPPHWFLAALASSSVPKPVIPTAALQHAVGGAFPAMAMVRALSVGDDETATRLGALSLVEEDLALADYVTGGQAGLGDLLRAMLDRTRTEMAA